MNIINRRVKSWLCLLLALVIMLTVYICLIGFGIYGSIVRNNLEFRAIIQSNNSSTITSVEPNVSTTIQSILTTTVLPITTTNSSDNQSITIAGPLMTHYTKLKWKAGEWYRPVLATFDKAATYEMAKWSCKRLSLFDPADNQRYNLILPNVQMCDKMINQIVFKNMNEYAGSLIWTSMFTLSISDDPQLAYSPPDSWGQYYMKNSAQLFCPPFYKKISPFQTSLSDHVWVNYKLTFKRESSVKIRIVKDFTFLNASESKWPIGWFPGCWRPYDNSTNGDPKELKFICQSFQSVNNSNWTKQATPGSTQRLPFYRYPPPQLNLTPSDIDNSLSTLTLVPVPKP